ncbi:MAG: helix-turn-helix domain-containing protein [Patescibacteria group bacterium]
MEKTQKQYYSVKELADLARTSRVTIFKKVKSGQIKGEKVGRNYIIKKEDIKDFLTTKLTDRVKKEIDSGVVEVIKQYGEVLKKLGKE